ncbi:unnamed protein product [Meganyctiphanes norvegica]|uniref:Uncharacterized protein n=1 Tax=Meganyctiphanes norvegica TaxID=48144 RepID=A0AAV2PLC5_MEGNR
MVFMQSGDEGDDELTPNTSIDSDSLRRRQGVPLPKIHENLPSGGGGGVAAPPQDGIVVSGVVAEGGLGGAGGTGRELGDVQQQQLGGPGHGGGGGGSVGPRVARGERASQQPAGHPPTALLQQAQQQQHLVLPQHTYVPNHTQPQHYHLPPRRPAPSPIHGGRTSASNPTRPGAIASLGFGTSYITTSSAPPSAANAAHRSQEPPKRVTVKSYTQPRFAPQVSSSSGTVTPSDSSPSTPTYDRRQLGDGTSSASPSVERREHEPTAPPKEEVYAEARKRWANKGGYTEVYNSKKTAEYKKKQPHEYPGAQRVLPDLQGSYQFSQPTTPAVAAAAAAAAAEAASKQPTTAAYSTAHTATTDTQTYYTESNTDRDRYLESVPYSPLRKYPSKDSFTQTSLYQEIDDSIPEIHILREATSQGPAPKESFPGPQVSQYQPREVSPLLPRAAPAGTQCPPRRPSVASSSGYSTTQETETTGAWVEQPGGGAKFVPTKVVKKDPAKPAGSLVWVNQPGGGAKLEWLPAPRSSSVSTLSRPSPQPPTAGHQRMPSSPAMMQRPQGAVANDIRNRAPDPRSPSSAAQWEGDRGGGGGGGGATEEEHVPRVGAVSASAMPRAGDAGNGIPRVLLHHDPTVTTTGRPPPPPQQEPVHAAQSPDHTYAQLNTNYTSQPPKNVYSSAPGDTARPAGRTSVEDEDEGPVLTVAGRAKGQTVRIRVRPDVHAYLTGQPTAYITAALAAAAAAEASSQGRRDSDAHGSSSGSALTAGSEGEGSLGYHENDYEEVVDEYTLLRRAVDDHDPEAMQLLVQAEQALNPDNNSSVVRPNDPGEIMIYEHGESLQKNEKNFSMKKMQKKKSNIGSKQERCVIN